MITIKEILKGGKCIGICDCGVEKEFLTHNVRSGKSKTCGCSNRVDDVPLEIRRTFTLMKYRCNTETSPDYENWGGKGIKVLYADYREFYRDVGDKPSKKHTIDRINSDGHYEIGNCRWATSKEQSNDLSSNHRIEYNGITKNMTEWALEYGIKPSTLRERLMRGWSIENALNKSVETKFHKGKDNGASQQ